MNRSAEHTRLVKAILGDLGAEPGLLLVRNDTGVARFITATMKEHFVHYGFPSHNGGPDILAVLAPTATLFGLEAKTGAATLTKEQRECHAVLAQFGVRVFVVRSVGDARQAIQEMRGRVAA